MDYLKMMIVVSRLMVKKMVVFITPATQYYDQVLIPIFQSDCYDFLTPLSIFDTDYPALSILYMTVVIVNYFLFHSTMIVNDFTEQFTETEQAPLQAKIQSSHPLL